MQNLIRMKFLLYSFLAITLIACSGSAEVELTEADVDEYVEQKLSSSEIYDIAVSMRFSKENEAYSVVEYGQNDTIVLVNEEIELADKLVIRNTFYKNSQPVFIEEFDYPYFETENYFERKIYLNGTSVIQGYQRESFYEHELDQAKFDKITVSIDDYDFIRPIDAINQEGDYEMKYGEFLIIDPQRYLILGNDQSDYSVALFLMKGDLLIEELYNFPEKYKGKTIFIHHEFLDMNGIERMIYKGGIVSEN